MIMGDDITHDPGRSRISVDTAANQTLKHLNHVKTMLSAFSYRPDSSPKQ